MAYDNFGVHAPTGYSEKYIVSSNPYAPEGRNIGYPSKFSVYVRKIAEADGSQTVVESRAVTDLVGNRVYLYHRPMINSDGTVTTITVGGGGSPTIDASATNAKQGYVVFSSLPTSAFTLTYTASPDCGSLWYINDLQDDVMEIEKILGPTNLTGYPGIRNLAYGIFDSPAAAVALGVAQNAIYLSDLDRNIRISSSTDGAISATRGTQHTIQLGYQTDAVVADVTGFRIQQSDGTKTSKIELGIRTGDKITYMGSLSGEGPLTIGGPSWPGYSGKVFTTGLTGAFYSGAMLRVHGDVAIMGGMKSIGPITIVTTTGTTSTVLGDWTIGDELFVYGTSHLIGLTETNTLNAQQNINIYSDIVAQNLAGSGGAGQSLVDGLDCSEVANSYATMAKKVFQYSVLNGPRTLTATGPKLTVNSPYYSLSGRHTVGDVFVLGATVNASSGPSGAHPNIIQLNTRWPIVGNSVYGTSGSITGYWSPGMMDPGSLWIRITNGQAAGFESPIYGYTIESGNSTSILGINVFCPELVEPRPTTNDVAVVFNPGTIPYNFIAAQGGASPTFTVSGSTSEPLELAFNDQVRIMRSATSQYSLSTALGLSISGQAGTQQTGVAYIFADLTGTDPEASPIFKAKPVPFRMPRQLLIGEVTALLEGGVWSVLETTSYRPGGLYDSGWLPIVTGYNTCSGRFVKALADGSAANGRNYFQHQLGADIDLARTSMDLYLGTKYNVTSNFNQTHTPIYSFFGQDQRTPIGVTSGSFIKVPLTASRIATSTTARDATLFYLDGKVAGIDLSPNLLDAMPTGSAGGNTSTFNYLRLVMKRDI